MIDIVVYDLNRRSLGPIVDTQVDETAASTTILLYLDEGWYCRGPSTSGAFRLISPDTWTGRFAAYFSLAREEPATTTQEVP